MAKDVRYILACLLFFLTVQLLRLCSAECQTAGKFGENCQHQCNCNGTCDGITGICPALCTEGFQGPTCQKRNAALRKTATSSSSDGRRTADRAVDGDTRQDVFTGACFHSAVGLSSNYWSVNLGAVFPMDDIVIYYRTGYTDRFVNATILVANATGGEVLCATVTSKDGDSNAVYRYTCSSYGSKLILRHDSPCGACILEPCEVQVLVCTNGTYGQNCSGQCGHCSDGTDCHHVTGLCPNGICQPGYRGDKCEQKFSKGIYGQSCSGQCGHCLDGARCHHVTGSCLNGGCQPGYRGDKCDETCINGTYGQNCSGQCDHCSDGANCHHVTGSCLSRYCQPGYEGERCDQMCTHGTYGKNCSGQCGHCSNSANCHHATGSCLSGSCQPGYKGDKCDEGLTTAVTERQCPAACTCQTPTATPASMDGLGVGIAIGVGSTLALGAVSLAAFCLGRRYQRGPGETRSSNPRRDTDRSQDTGDRVYHNSASRPEEAEGNGQYETLDAASREVKVTNDYVSIVSKDA